MIQFSKKSQRLSINVIAGALLALSVGSVQADSPTTYSPTTQKTISGVDVNDLVAFNIRGGTCRPW